MPTEQLTKEQMAARVLRQAAPMQSHEGRHACFEVADMLEKGDCQMMMALAVSTERRLIANWLRGPVASEDLAAINRVAAGMIENGTYIAGAEIGS